MFKRHARLYVEGMGVVNAATKVTELVMAYQVQAGIWAKDKKSITKRRA